MAVVFVTGPTGVLGRATTPRLIDAGHTVRALSRSDGNDAAIRELGAEPVRASLFDVDTLAEAVRGADAILHLATRIPPSSQVRRRDAWLENDRIRAEGTRNLVDAGIRAGVSTFVYPGFAYVYPDSGDRWIDAATTPAMPAAMLESSIAAEGEVARFAKSQPSGKRRGISLRLGGLYGSSLASTAEQVALARRGLSMLGGSPGAYAPMLWIDDAASALVAAFEHAPSGLYDVVEDEPLRHEELNRLLAEVAGRRRVIVPPRWFLRLAGGPAGATLASSMRISNRRFKEATGWQPAVPSAREGLARIAASLAPASRTRVPLGVTAGLWALLLLNLLAGLQQQLAPRAFYDTFPGFGMTWVSVDGPYNEHLLRDLGGANLALSVVMLFAILRPSAGLARAVATAVLVAQTPHFIYHATHLGLLPTLLEQVLQTGSLSVMLVIAVFILIRAGCIRHVPAGGHQPSLPGGADLQSARPRLIVSPH